MKRKIIFLRGGKNCKSDEIPESYQTLKGYFRDGKHPSWVFKIGSRLVVDLEARERDIEKARQACIAAAPKRQRQAEVRKRIQTEVS